MKIVSLDKISKFSDNTPLDDLTKLYSTFQKMEKLCVKNNGVGLAAVQVGIPWKCFVYQDQTTRKFNYMIDCEYFPLSEDKYLSIEGCLSLKNDRGKMRHFKVNRFKKIKVVGKILIDREKIELRDFEKVFSNSLECAILQHEIDHQDNILLTDIGQEIFIREEIRKS